MSDLRYRTMRLKVYAQLLPRETAAQERQEFLEDLDRMDEDAITGFFERIPAEGTDEALAGDSPRGERPRGSAECDGPDTAGPSPHRDCRLLSPASGPRR